MRRRVSRVLLPVLIVSAAFLEPALARDEIVLADPLIRVTLHLSPCSMALHTRGGLSSQGEPWTVKVGNRLLQGRDFTATVKRLTSCEADLDLADRLALGLRGRLTLRLHDGRLQAAMRLDATPHRLEVAFPLLQNVRADDGTDLTYCFPRCGALVNHIPISVKASRGGGLPVQFMDACTDHAGLAVFTRARDDRGFSYRLEKRGAITMAVDSEAPAHTPWVSPPALVRAHAGDWHVALDDYRAWLATWLHPAAPLKPWFRNVFTLRQQFLRFSGFCDGTYFRDGRPRLREGLDADTRSLGPIDFLHLFDWGASKTRGRVGSYDAWDEIGGLETFRREVRQAGMPVGLYLEGYLVDRAAPLAARAAAWQLRDERRQPASPFPPALAMCPAVPAWRAWLAATYARVQRQTAVSAFYVDEVGLADSARACHAPDHGHPVPSVPLAGERLLLADLRRAVGRQAALYCEETPADVAAIHVDGSFTYAVMSASAEWSPSHVNLTRFALPGVKTFEILTGDAPLGDRLDLVSATFFNGEGIWLMGPARTAFSPRVRAFVRRMHDVMRAHADCFTSMKSVPLVRCLPITVFANQFPGQNRTLWTLYNPGRTLVREVTLPSPPTNGPWRDAWNGRPLRATLVPGGYRVDLTIPAGGVGCVVTTRQPSAVSR